MFGGLSLSPGGAELPAEVAHIGRDPFDPAFDLDAAARRMRAKRTGVKRALLDQTLVSGIGNIYADEALWRARTHYARATAKLGQRRPGRCSTAAPDVMAPPWSRAAPPSTPSTSTSTARAATSTARWPSTARRAGPARAAARRSAASRS